MSGRIVLALRIEDKGLMRIVHYVCLPHDLVTRELIVEGEVSLCTEHHDKDYKQVWYIEGDGPTENR